MCQKSVFFHKVSAQQQPPRPSHGPRAFEFIQITRIHEKPQGQPTASIQKTFILAQLQNNSETTQLLITSQSE